MFLLFIEDIAFENVVHKIAVILFGPSFFEGHFH